MFILPNNLTLFTYLHYTILSDSAFRSLLLQKQESSINTSAGLLTRSRFAVFSFRAFCRKNDIHRAKLLAELTAGDSVSDSHRIPF